MKAFFLVSILLSGALYSVNSFAFAPDAEVTSSVSEEQRTDTAQNKTSEYVLEFEGVQYACHKSNGNGEGLPTRLRRIIKNLFGYASTDKNIQLPSFGQQLKDRGITFKQRMEDGTLRSTQNIPCNPAVQTCC